MQRDPARRTSLRTRLGIIAVVFLVMVLVAVGLSALMIRQWDRTLDARGEARAAVADVAELSLSLSDQETGIRGYLLTADDGFLEPYYEGATIQTDIVSRLLERDLDLPDFVALVDIAVDTGEQWRNDVAEPILADIEAAPDDEFAQQRFDQVRDALDALDAAVVIHVDELAERARQIQRNVIGVLFLSALAAILGTALAASLFRRWVLRPLTRIGDAARALSHDDTVPLPAFDAPELQDVSDAVGQLQRSLRSARDDAVAALRGIEQSAVLAIQVRSELADEIGEMPDGWAAHTLLVPAEGVVAGDCFDIGLLDAAHLYIVLIDVTGHGASAALNALKAKSQLRAALRTRLSPGASLDWLSREMLKDERADLLTASVVVIDLDTGHLTYANAGHPAPILTDGDQRLVLDGSGPLIGAFAATWSTYEAELPAGWTLLTHTDGLTDTIGADRERFGDERLASCLSTTDPVALLAQIQDATEAFRVGDRSDDLTAIAVRRAPITDTANHQNDDAAASDDHRNGTITP
ncbi:MAG: SpoIIE family protein phosphatase [Ilumatobacter fluminis]|uniref:PP2C family protein-serine/threonine phosphatase n=1 Tax=Ilumatobacter fluminis TaxID=467091 RepID=UPI0032EBE346